MFFGTIRRLGSGFLLAGVVAITGCGGGETPYLGADYETQYFGQSRQEGGAPAGPVEIIDDVSFWDGVDYGGGPASITINLTEQKAYFYQGGKLAGVALVATGKEGFGTPAGTFKIMEKIVDKRSNLYGYMHDAAGNVVNYDADIRKDPVPPGGRFEGAPMPYWMRLTSGGVGMHQGPIPVPGSPASHGCIRISKAVVQDFFAHVHVGTPVRIMY